MYFRITIASRTMAKATGRRKRLYGGPRWTGQRTRLYKRTQCRGRHPVKCPGPLMFPLPFFPGLYSASTNLAAGGIESVPYHLMNICVVAMPGGGRRESHGMPRDTKSDFDLKLVPFVAVMMGKVKNHLALLNSWMHLGQTFGMGLHFLLNLNRSRHIMESNGEWKVHANSFRFRGWLVTRSFGGREREQSGKMFCLLPPTPNKSPEAGPGRRRIRYAFPITDQ